MDAETQRAPSVAEYEDPQTCAIIGAGMKICSELGYGFHEAAYQEALAIEFEMRGIPAQRELPSRSRGRKFSCACLADFFCFGEVIVELKALAALSPIEDARLLHYLKAGGFHLGLLPNFGSREF